MPPQKKQYSDVPQVLRDYLSYMTVIKGKSPNTVKEYYYDLRLFLRFIKCKFSIILSFIYNLHRDILQAGQKAIKNSKPGRCFTAVMAFFRIFAVLSFSGFIKYPHIRINPRLRNCVLFVHPIVH